MRRTPIGALCGVLAAAAGVTAGQLLAAVTHPAAGPLVAVGSAVIDATPTPVKDFAVSRLGTNDKPFLLAGVAVVVAAVAAVVGVLGLRSRTFALAGAAAIGAVGAAAALSRPASVVADVVPSLLAAVIAAVTLLWLTSYARTRVVEHPPVLVPVGGGPEPAGTGVPSDFDRRGFLRAALLAGAATVAVGGGAAVAGRVRGGATARSRAQIRLPVPADPAAPIPAGVAPGFVTPNSAFYRVDTALTVPAIDVADWSLRVHGMVDRSASFSFEDLLNRPLIERTITLNCVSNEVGGPYIGTARWLGVPLAPLLRDLGVRSGADQMVARSAEGMTIGTPIQTVLDGRDTMLCLGMNGEPLPTEHGFPVRMLTPGLFGYAGACKWITEIELTTFAAFDAYWVKRGWARRGPVKTASRIDKPAPLAQLAPGKVTVAGVAWAQHRGIKQVEVRVDDGEWAVAELLPVPSIDTWVQWRHTWNATPGLHSLAVRATDGTGAVQPAIRVPPFPSGATGWQTITVTVTG